MVDLDSDPTKLIEVVEIGKQFLMTRGALTTFSIANLLIWGLGGVLLPFPAIKLIDMIMVAFHFVA